MGIKNILYTEKGKITAGVLASVLLTTAIIVPVSIFSDRAINNNGEKLIQTYGYDSTATSTGARQDWWMNIGGVDASKANMDAKLIQNQNYHSVTKAEEMIDGVVSTNGVSYLSNTDVMKHNSQIKPLDISIDHGNGEWINPEDNDYIAAPLNINMKVPKDVADVLRAHLATNSSTSNFDPNTLPTNYLNFLKDNNLLWKFALSFIVFNYATFSLEAHNALKEINLSPINIDNKMTDDEFKQWVNSTFNPSEWNWNSDIEKYQMVVDGTGTDEVALNKIIDAFNKSAIIKTEVMQSLNNGGSYRAWETVEGFDIPGVINNPDEYDSSQDGSKEAFIGTQSRGIETNKIAGGVDGAIIDDGTNKGEISYWGYDESIYDDEYSSKNEDDVIYNINDLSKPGMPLSTTMAADKIVFFTTNNQSIVDPLTGETKNIKGVTREGFRDMFEFGVSWQTLANLNQLELV